MGVTSCPSDKLGTKTAICAICGHDRLLHDLFVGTCDLDGEQAFACNSHILEALQLIFGWADFGVRQRNEARHRELQGLDLEFGS